MKRVVAGLLAGVLAVSMLAGCSKQLTPEEQAASEAAVLAQQLQDEEDQTGLKRLISNNITEYEQPFYDFVESLQEGDADKAATALGVPNTFGSNLQNWVIVNNYETFQKNELQHICFNSAKDGAAAVLNVYLKYPGEVTKDTSPDYVMNVDYVDGAWSLTPPTGVVKDYAFTTPTNKVSFEGTDLSSYASKSAETDVWTITLPRALDFEDGSTYVVTNDMGDFNAHIYDMSFAAFCIRCSKITSRIRAKASRVGKAKNLAPVPCKTILIARSKGRAMVRTSLRCLPVNWLKL